ncbi:MAG: DUF7533 family protein [Halobacteriota archaeon]
MAMGILETVQLAATLIFALPLGILGVQYLLSGENFLGGILVVIAVLMVVVPRVLTTPADIPEKVLGKAVGKAVKMPEDGEEK